MHIADIINNSIDLKGKLLCPDNNEPKYPIQYSRFKSINKQTFLMYHL